MKLKISIMPQFIILLFSFLILTGCNHLLYPAERESYIEAKYIKPPPQDIYISVNDTEKIHAWHFSSESKIKKGIVLHFHGNGQNLTTHFQFFRWMTQFGFDYIIIDYRGYGKSSGAQATQEKTVQDGLAAFKYVKENFKDLPLIAIGQSLGSNVLVRTLQDLDLKLYPDLVVLDSSFLSYQAAARSILKQKWFLYPIIPLTYLAIDDDFSAKKNIEKTPVLPALFFHGTADPLIQMNLGKENFDLWRGSKNFISNEGGAHIAAFGDPRFANSNKEILLTCFEFIVSKKMDQFNQCVLK
jgi:uncharacterized protein